MKTDNKQFIYEHVFFTEIKMTGAIQEHPVNEKILQKERFDMGFGYKIDCDNELRY